jgi:hypothetical protein
MSYVSESRDGRCASAFGTDSAAIRILLLGIAFQVAMFVPSLLALFFDERMVNGINLWIKPLKFQLSLSLHMLTMALLLPLLSKQWQESRLMRYTGSAVAFSALFETAYITLQSSRGRASHYAVSTGFEALMWSLMGVGAVVLVVGSFIQGVAIWRSTPMPRTGLRLGAILGLTIGSLLTLFTAGFMSSSLVVETGRMVAGVKSDVNGLPLVGWSTTGGDLRVSHFFATHMMQALPMVGMLADRWVPKGSKATIVIATAFSVFLVVLTFRQALQGKAFLVL